MGVNPTVVLGLIFSLHSVDAFSPTGPLPLLKLKLKLDPWTTTATTRRGATIAEADESLEASLVDDTSSSGGFWRQPPSIVRSRLQSPPPDHILDAIASQPYRGGFEPVHDFPRPTSPKIVQGSIPKDLVGTLAINAAGRIRVGGRMLGHWFDGDGYMTTLSFDGKTNEARAFGRYVRTDRYKAQEEVDATPGAADVNYETPLAFSGAWTNAGKGTWYENIGKIPQNPANTATMWLPPLKPSSNPRLFAICEGGHPIEIDPITLEVIGEEGPFTCPKGENAVESYFSAHFSQDPQTQHIFNHGYILDPLGSACTINLMEFSKDGLLLKQKMSEMPYNTFVHDATISQNHYLYFVCPYIVPKGMAELGPFVMGQKALGKMMTWKGGPTNDSDNAPLKSYLQIHSKEDLNLKWRVEMPDPVSLYHIVDAFETASEDDNNELHLKVRVAELDCDNVDRNKLEEQFSNQYAVPSGERLHAKLTEYTFSLREDGSGEGKLMSSKELSSDACEYPVTNQIGKDKRLQYTWINAMDDKSSDWFDAVQKLDMVNEDDVSLSPMKSFGEGAHCGPPFFIPKESLDTATKNNDDGDIMHQYNEDEGYIVVVLYISEAHRSDVVILDSATLDLLCTMELDCHIPYSFHGEFQPGLVPSQN